MAFVTASSSWSLPRVMRAAIESETSRSQSDSWLSSLPLMTAFSDYCWAPVKLALLE